MHGTGQRRTCCLISIHNLALDIGSCLSSYSLMAGASHVAKQLLNNGESDTTRVAVAYLTMYTTFKPQGVISSFAWAQQVRFFVVQCTVSARPSQVQVMLQSV